MFEPLYKAYVHMPWAGWIPATILFVVLMRKLPYFYGMMGVFTLFAFLDGLRSAEWLRIGGADHPLYQYFLLLFILFGDLRYFLLMYRYGKHRDRPEDRGGTPVMWARVIAWTLVPSVALVIAEAIIPQAFVEPRHIFLVYELIMFCAALLFLGALLPSWFPRRQDPELYTWLRRITYVELLHYGLWVLSDVLILSGMDAGYALRFIPDFVYYSLFILAVYMFAPARLKRANFGVT